MAEHEHEHMIRSEECKKKLLRRLSIIEGQIRGIRGMVERDDYCVDILTQAAAARCALNSFSTELLSTHLRTCVAAELQEGGTQKIDELMDLLQKLLK